MQTYNPSPLPSPPLERPRLLDSAAAAPHRADPAAGDGGCSGVCPDPAGGAGGGEPRVPDRDGAHAGPAGVRQPRGVALW